MYTLYLEDGSVVRDADGVIVAPCQSIEEQNFKDYIAWVEAGNEPVLVDTRG